LIEEAGFPLHRTEPRLTPEKIEHIGKVDKAEKFAPAFSKAELVQRIESETQCLGELRPAAAITGSSVAIPVTCRRLQIPLVWVIQSTWLEGFFAHGAGMTDGIRLPPLKWAADKAILLFINFWIRYGFMSTLNQAAGHLGVEGYRSIFDYWRGDVTLVAEPAEFSGAALPPNHYYTGPLIARQDFPVPDEVRIIPPRPAPDLLRHGHLGDAGDHGQDHRKLCRQVLSKCSQVTSISARRAALELLNRVLVTYLACDRPGTLPARQGARCAHS
jgi:hypothetical protein